MNYELRMTNGDRYHVDEECYAVVKRYMDGSGSQKSVVGTEAGRTEAATVSCHILLDHVVAVIEREAGTT